MDALSLAQLCESLLPLGYDGIGRFGAVVKEWAASVASKAGTDSVSSVAVRSVSTATVYVRAIQDVFDNDGLGGSQETILTEFPKFVEGLKEALQLTMCEAGGSSIYCAVVGPPSPSCCDTPLEFSITREASSLVAEVRSMLPSAIVPYSLPMH